MKQMAHWIFWTGLVVVFWGAGQPRAEAVILINELLADPAGDANRDGGVHSTRDEFIELVNTDGSPASLAGWSLADRVRVRHRFSGAASIPPHDFFVVFGGGVPQGFPSATIASSGSLGLNNAGDTVTLLDAAGVSVDTVIYGAEGGRDASLTRSPDATGPFVLHASVSPFAFSPGTTVGGLSRLSVAMGDPLPDPPRDVVTPEPSSLALMGLGLLGLSRRRHTP